MVWYVSTVLFTLFAHSQKKKVVSTEASMSNRGAWVATCIYFQIP